MVDIFARSKIRRTSQLIQDIQNSMPLRIVLVLVVVVVIDPPL